MKQEHEQAPELIFNWLEAIKFEALDAAQKAEVLRFFTPGEYNDMHEAMSCIRQSGGAEQKKSEGKITLLERYDNHHGTGKKTRIFHLRVPELSWKIAAGLSPFLLAWIVFSLFRKPDMGAREMIASTDTVYITRQSNGPVAYVHDTVYKTVKETRTDPGPKRPAINESSGLLEPVVVDEEDIPVLSLDDLESAPNAIKGNSMQDDSLWRRFGYISL